MVRFVGDRIWTGTCPKKQDFPQLFNLSMCSSVLSVFMYYLKRCPSPVGSANVELVEKPEKQPKVRAEDLWPLLSHFAVDHDVLSGCRKYVY